MKTFISKLVIASILSITLVAVTSISSHISQKYLSANVAQTQPGPEILAGSYSEMMNTLIATSGR
jgi:hypothetical protein